MKSHILIGCGTNLKNPLAQLSKALHILLSKNFIALRKISPVYLTEPLGHKEQPNFLNCIISIRARVSAHSLLKTLLLIEKRMGRVRTFKNAPRVIDLDLILFKQEKKNIARFPCLSLPHPEILHRKFVLQPILDVDTYTKIPGKRPGYYYLRNINDQKIKKTKKKVRLPFKLSNRFRRQ